MDYPVRRRSPGWVRALARPQLHALAVRLTRDFAEEGLSARQEWLWGAVLSELEYRHRRQPDLLKRCWCGLCRPCDEWSELGEYVG